VFFVQLRIAASVQLRDALLANPRIRLRLQQRTRTGSSSSSPRSS